MYTTRCQYPNVCYGPPDFMRPVPTGKWAAPASKPLSGFGVNTPSASSAGLGLLLGIGAILALVVVASTKG